MARGNGPVEIRVNVSRPSHAISPRLIGAFFEDINFGADGGLVAELVKNGSFEAPVPILGWTCEGEGITASRESDAPISAANPHYLRVRSAGEEPQGFVANSGFRGMGVHGGKPLRGSLRVRAIAGAKTSLQVRVVSPDGETLAEATTPVGGSEWRNERLELIPTRTEAKARLELRVLGGGSVDVDNVSLEPVDTWRGLEGGLRRDLVELLAALKPAFFRFPGGCIVEGSQLKYRYQWKTTIGPRDERRMLVNRWNTEFAHRPAPDYYQSFALGFYEYFQLSEDLGAEPLPILNCGMACQFNSGELAPLEELDQYVQDALDLIEFANGPAESGWGARRAAMGHPEPFGMRLLGVGNEQWGPDYFERYRRFAEVLAKRHPEIELVTTAGPFPSGGHFDYAWPLLRQIRATIVDEHCYAMPDWFLREAHRFDRYDRQGPRVFMGEYAAQSVQIASTQNQNNLRCAIAEAAFLTGVERNSDVVAMSAYAPLLGHEEAWQWRPNLIWFDNLSSYATPNYYVQKLFSEHRGDVTLPTEVVDGRPGPPHPVRFGLGSHEASVEFRNLLPASNPAPEDGDWQSADGVVRQTQPHGVLRALLPPGDAGDAVFECQARKVSGREGFSVFIRCGDGGSHLEWRLGASGNRSHQLIDHQATHSTTPRVLADREGTLDEGRAYRLRVETTGDHVRCLLDGEVIHDVEAPVPAIDRLFASSSLSKDASEAIIKLVNPTATPTEVRLQLEGVADHPLPCRVIRLAGDPEDKNSIGEPHRVRPNESMAELAGPAPTVEAPAHSLTIYRVKIAEAR